MGGLDEWMELTGMEAMCFAAPDIVCFAHFPSAGTRLILSFENNLSTFGGGEGERESDVK